MKLNLILAILFTGIFMTSAQAQLGFGIRGGVNSANFSGKDFVSSDYKIEYASSRDIGFHFGVVGQLKIVKFFFQPEVLFTHNKTDIKVSDLTDNSVDYSASIGEQKFSKLDVPLIVGLKFAALKVQAGPVASVLLNSKSDLLKEEGIDQAYKGATFGYQAGLGLQLSSLLIDVKYEGNLSKFGDGVTIGNQTYNYDQRMNQWILSLGFLF